MVVIVENTKQNFYVNIIKESRQEHHQFSSFCRREEKTLSLFIIWKIQFFSTWWFPHNVRYEEYFMIISFQLKTKNCHWKDN